MLSQLFNAQVSHHGGSIGGTLVLVISTSWHTWAGDRSVVLVQGGCFFFFFLTVMLHNRSLFYIDSSISNTLIVNHYD